MKKKPNITTCQSSSRRHFGVLLNFTKNLKVCAYVLTLKTNENSEKFFRNIGESLNITINSRYLFIQFFFHQQKQNTLLTQSEMNNFTYYMDNGRQRETILQQFNS